MRLLSHYELFIFDWDHTLTTSTLLVTLLYMASRRGKHRSAETLRKSAPSNFSTEGVAVKEETSKIYSLFDDAYSLIFRPKLKPGALELLKFLKGKGKKIAIFSDSKAYRLLSETKQLGVRDYVDFALSAESISRYKPNPTGLLLLTDRLRVPKEKCLYVGDMAGDILTAKLAGMDSCGVADGIGSLESLSVENPEHVFPRLSSFFQALREGE